MLPQPDFLYPQPVGVFDLLQGVVQSLRLSEVFMVRDDGKESEFHVASLAWAMAFPARQLYYIIGQDGQDDCILFIIQTGRQTGRTSRGPS